MYTINFWPILVASVVSFGIGALWYSPVLFGNEWMTLSKKSSADMAAMYGKGAWKRYVVQFIVTFVTLAVLGFLISATNALTAIDGAFLGLIIWFGFVATDAIGTLMWDHKPLKLLLINAVITLVTLVVGGAIIGAWR